MDTAKKLTTTVMSPDGQTKTKETSVISEHTLNVIINEQPIYRIVCMSMIFISGRDPVDMVEKVIVAGIPVLVSKSVPTAESVELAEEYNLKLICKAWPDQCEIFTDYRGNRSV